jgi:hypothetical protein
MSNQIRIKRRLKGSTETSLPDLLTGELAYDEVKGKLYIGESDGSLVNAKEIGGSGWLLPQITGITNNIYVPKNGDGANGTWNISVTGNAGFVTNGVYTTGNQSISGIKTFSSGLLVTTTGISNGEGFDFVGSSGNGIYVPSGTIRTKDLYVDGWLTVGTKLDILSAAEILSRGPIVYKADKYIFESGIGIFTNGLYVGPTGSPTGVSLSGHKHDYTDISNFCTGVASCVNTSLNAGSGLVLNYLEASGIYLDIGQGDGIVVSDNYISVDSTIVRTSGAQNISGVKTFYNGPLTDLTIKTNTSGTGNLVFMDGTHYGYFGWDGTNHSLIFDSSISSGSLDIRKTLKYKVPSTGTVATSIPVFTGGNPSVVSETITSRSVSDFKSDLSLNNVSNNNQMIAYAGRTSGYVPTWSGTDGTTLNSGYAVTSNLTNDTTAAYLVTASGAKSYVDAQVGGATSIVRTTGSQNISGVKTFFDTPTFNTGILSSGTNTLQVASTSLTATQFVVFTEDPSASSKAIYTRTPSQVRSDIGLGNVTNHVQMKQSSDTTVVGYVPTWNSTSGDILGSGYMVTSNLTNDNTSIYLVTASGAKSYVDAQVGGATSIVRTTGTQAIGGVKVFQNIVITGNGGSASSLVFDDNFTTASVDSLFNPRLGISTYLAADNTPAPNTELIIGYNPNGYSETTNTRLFAGQNEVGALSFETANGKVSRLVFDIRAPSASAKTTLRTKSSAGDIIIDLPNTSGTLALLANINTSQITGTLPVNKGGTNITSYSNGQLLIGSGTSLAANTLTQGDGTTITNGSGTIGIAVNNTVVRTTGNQDIVGAKQFYESSNSQVIFGTADDKIRVKAPNTDNQTYYFVGLDGGGSPPSSNSADRSLVSRSASQVKTDLSLNNVTNHVQMKQSSDTTVVGYVPTWNSTSGELLASGYAVSTNLSTNSGSSYIPRADALVSYVNSAINNGIATNDAMIFKTTLDCSANPNYPAADRGWVYKISVAGKIGGASGPVVEVNDTIICGNDSTPSGDHATVGSNWHILQTNIVDSSILVTGPSTATSGNIALFNGTTGKAITGSIIFQSGNNIGIGNNSANGYDGSLSVGTGNFTTVLTVGTTGVSLSGHTHTVSNISDFGRGVSGLIVGSGNYLTRFNASNSGITNSIIYQSGDNIGIGTENPDQCLTVNGTFRSSEILTKSLTISDLYGANPSLDIDVYSTNNHRLLIDHSNGVINLYDTLGLIGPNNSVYIGPNAGSKIPASKLDVSGIITATSGNSNQWNMAYGWGNHASGGYAQNSSVVKTTGNQTTSGIKTFIDVPVFSGGISITSASTPTVSWIACFDGADPTGTAVPIQRISVADFKNDIGLVSSNITTPSGNSLSHLNLLTDSFADNGAGSACQILQKNASNTAYEFTSSLCNITIDCGTF